MVSKEINFRQAKLLATCGLASQFPAPDPAKPEIVLAGKSNVGKSTLINALTGKKKLAYTSQTPGKTRLINFFEVDNFLRLVDVPGYGFAQAASAELAKYSRLTDQYITSDRPLLHILLLLDSRHEPGVNDWQMMDWLQTIGHPWSIVLTKTDKLSRQKTLCQQRNIKSSIDNQFSFDEGDLLVHTVAAEKGTGIKELRQFLAGLAGGRAKKTD
ncbi:MAG TPA: YihA family ribosome biogenesis GTP-binding protein [Clostridiaceae bacterium]|nr:YihA family ribosome biogenesis GTP-binding protein [Clostridiaceae bacterium]